jgi:LPPG:FO 2-phospho-L-lactate transferase
MIVALTGGTGGAKLIEGLAAEMDPAQLTVICNTGDDANFFGLHVSPDLDTILYTLAGLHDPAKGWGIAGDSFIVLEQLGHLGRETWFKIGDKDFATHILRTRLMQKGMCLSEVTERLRRALGVKTTILPMCNEPVETRLTTPEGEVPFQEYFVKQKWSPEVTAVRFEDVEESLPAPGVIEAIRDAAAIFICPSNPITSIGPILAVPGMRTALSQCTVPILAVSPIVGAAAISGPAHRLMSACGYEGSALGVAQAYADFLDQLMIADQDGSSIGAIEQLQIEVIVGDILMPDLTAKRRLARQLLELVSK